MKKTPDTVLKEYEILVNSSIQLTRWRQDANGFYLAVNAAILSLDSYLASIGISGSIVIAIFGILISFLWFRTISYYRGLNDAKFKIIDNLEERLPVAIFREEWKEFKRMRIPTTTDIEKWVPKIFMAAYGLVIIYYILPLL